MAVASTFNKHIILVGLGHLGYRVVHKLVDMDKETVVIELDPKADLLENIRRLGVPIIQDDATTETVLEAAGIRRASAIILCTQNDTLNLQIAVKARSLNPDIQVIVRIFDDDFAQALQKQFGFTALSATGMAAPIFAAAAANIDITPPISIEGHLNSLAKMLVSPKSGLIGLSVDQIENQYHTSIVMHGRAGHIKFHPAGTTTVQSGDVIAVLGHPDQINILINKNSL